MEEGLAGQPEDIEERVVVNTRGCQPLNLRAVEPFTTVVISMVGTSMAVQVLMRIERLVGVIGMANVPRYGTRSHVQLSADATEVRRYVIVVE